MKKIVKVLTTVTILGLIVFFDKTKTAKGEELQEESTYDVGIEQVETDDRSTPSINVEGIEFSSDEEALTYLTETYGLELPYSFELGTSYTIDLINDELVVSISTSSGIGTASSIGARNVYVQYGVPGSTMLGNHNPSGAFTTTNADSYDFTYQYSKLEKGYQYRSKQTHFIIVNGVEYTYTTITPFVSYYC